MKRVIKNPRSSEASIEDRLEQYIEYQKSKNRSKDTVRNITLSVNKWISYLKDVGYSLLPKEIKSQYIYSFRAHYLEEGMRPTTLNHYLRDIRSFIYWMSREGYCNLFKVELVKEEEVIKETYTDDELDRLLAPPRSNDNYGEWRTWAIINWLLATGNRASTLCNITLEDIDYENNDIIIKKTKTSKAYIIPLSSRLKTVLVEYTKKWRNDLDTKPTDYLFANIGNEQLTPNALHLAIARYNNARGVEKTSVHAFRHTFAKMWIRNNGDVFRLQKMLGHTTLDMTRKYVNLFSEDLKEGFASFNPLDTLSKGKSRTKKVGGN